MPFVVADRVKETTTTTGTGTITLAGASVGFRSFAAIGNGNNTYYTIASQVNSEWEVGIGTYTSSGTTLSRNTVLSSSNSGSLVNFSDGTKDVFVTYPSGGSLLVTNSATGLGYGTGVGGTVTQATNKNTAVTLNKLTGQITTSSAALANNTLVNFVCYNSFVAVNDSVIINLSNPPAYYRFEPPIVYAGAFQIFYTNLQGVSRSDAVVINFTVIKAANA